VAHFVDESHRLPHLCGTAPFPLPVKPEEKLANVIYQQVRQEREQAE